ncbi:MAG: polysaccharide deacetylase family protein [Blautia sp.]|nr:polysaccharide deacetylase family protein [Lachnoclostridium sp.]MCM1212032.1 polysaccharide deacetylase family protein [Blautia sp.]
MSRKKRRILFFLMIVVVSLLFYFLGRKQAGKQPLIGQTPTQQEQQTSVWQTQQPETTLKMETADGIIVQRITAQQTDTGEEAPERYEETKKIALTFDDGPHPQYTGQLLDGLKERGVCATFFVTGEHAALHPEIIERMNEEGHLIGNHTYSHIQLSKANRDKFKEELVKTNEIIGEITGNEVVYVRPPYGTWDKQFEADLNMIPVLWTIDPLDWCTTNVDRIVYKVVSKAEENDIILLHDYYETTVTAALKIIDKLQEDGYEFVTVEEILFD